MRMLSIQKYMSYFRLLKAVCYLMAMGGLCLLTSCDYEAKYSTRNVALTMEKVRVSAGFARFNFETDRPAYFLSGITRVPETTSVADILRYQEQFKTLMLDSAYLGYINWRQDKLANAVHDVADFRDHSLHYTFADQHFQFLQPSTRYIVFAFVVDPFLRRPAGPLVIEEIVTAAQSDIPMRFSYRINGYWDYVYPLQETIHSQDGASYSADAQDDALSSEMQVRYDLLTDVPWVGATVDSLWLREQGWERPGVFFTDSFLHISAATSHADVRVFYGLYAHNNEAYSDGLSPVGFEQGHTYYTGLASLDGPLLDSDGRPVSYAVYRFRWDGPSTQLYFHPGDPADTRGAW